MDRLAQDVQRLVSRVHCLEHLAGEVIATVALNVENGSLTAKDYQANQELTKMIAKWRKQLIESRA